MRVAGAMLALLATLTVGAASEDCALGWYWNGGEMPAAADLHAETPGVLDPEFS